MINFNCLKLHLFSKLSLELIVKNLENDLLNNYALIIDEYKI